MGKKKRPQSKTSPAVPKSRIGAAQLRENSPISAPKSSQQLNGRDLDANSASIEPNTSPAAANSSSIQAEFADSAAALVTAAATGAFLGFSENSMEIHNEASDSDFEMDTNLVGNVSEEYSFIPSDGDGFPPLSINKKQAPQKHARQVFVKLPQRKMKANEPSSDSVTLGSKDTTTGNLKSQSNKAWTSHFTNNRAPDEGLQLKFDASAVGNCKFEANELPTAYETWGPTLIGYVAGRFPGRQAIEQCYKSWGVPCDFSIHSSGWLVFRFKHENELNLVLEKGPFFIFQRPLILKTLPPFFQFDNTEITQVPIWVRLPCLPPECWNAYGLGKILSNVGIPIRTDALTAKHERVSFARALVEINIAKEVLKVVPVTLPNGKVHMQRVDYEFVPSFCHKCNAIGHDNANCRMNANRKPMKPANAMNSANDKAKANANQPKQISQPVAAINTHIRFGSPSSASGNKQNDQADAFGGSQQQHNAAGSLPQQQQHSAAGSLPQQQQASQASSSNSQQQQQGAHNNSSLQQQPLLAATNSKQQIPLERVNPMPKQQSMTASWNQKISSYVLAVQQASPNASASAKLTKAINSMDTCLGIKKFQRLVDEDEEAYQNSEEDDATSV